VYDTINLPEPNRGADMSVLILTVVVLPLTLEVNGALHTAVEGLNPLVDDSKCQMSALTVTFLMYALK
jgi:hypothetical protein